MDKETLGQILSSEMVGMGEQPHLAGLSPDQIQELRDFERNFSEANAITIRKTE